MSEPSKLGDRTVGATALQTVGNYERIGDFVLAVAHGQERAGAAEHADHGQHLRGDYARIDDLGERLTAAMERLSAIASLSDEQVSAVPRQGR